MRHLVRLGALAAVCGVAALGCGAGTHGALLDVTVSVDATLDLQDVLLVVSGGGRAPLERTFALGAPMGTPPAVAPVKLEIAIAEVPKTFVATLEARGQRKAAGATAVSTVVTAAVDVTVTAGGRIVATLALTADCDGVTCPGTEVCRAGTCGPRPVIGGAPDGGATPDGAAGSGAPDGGGAGTGGEAGSGGGAGSGGAAGTGAGEANGKACTVGSTCGSGNCVGGVCCDKPCAGTCMSCKNTLTGADDGTCAAVTVGKDDPMSRCPAAEAATTCGSTGHCDGKGACEKYGPATTCKPAACAGGMFTPASACDGAGVCTPRAATDCKGFACSMATGCATTCTGDGDCPAGYCTAAKTCAAKKAPGGTCGAGRECANGICAPDGICCDRACTGSCEACDLLGNVGTCAPVPSGPPHGSRAACAGSDPQCPGACGGRADGACVFAAKACGAATCSGTQVVAAGTCGAGGACVAPAPATCAGGYVCSGAACKTTCASNADCVADSFCYGGACHADAVSISESATNTCAATKDGRVFCWGDAASGVLGPTVTLPSAVPVQIAGITDAASVNVGSGLACALRKTGGVSCWGTGKLGDGVDHTAPSGPVAAATTAGPLLGVKVLAASSAGVCASTATAVYCWGANAYHNLGIDVDTVTQPSGTPRLRPTPVINGAGARAMALSAASDPLPVIATFDGTNECLWGKDGAAQMCVAASGTIAQIAASGAGTMICMRLGSRVLCSGNNDYKQCGSISALYVSPPGNDITIQAADLGAYYDFGCALTIDTPRVAKCWGVTFGDFTVSPTPVWATPTTIGMTAAPTGVSPFALATGGENAAHVCMIATDGSPWCVGRCFYGACGNGQSTATLGAFAAVHAGW